MKEVERDSLANGTQSKPLGTGEPVRREPGSGEPQVCKVVSSHGKEGLLLL